MKKKFYISLITISMIFVFVGCKEQNPINTEPISSNNSTKLGKILPINNILVDQFFDQSSTVEVCIWQTTSPLLAEQQEITCSVNSDYVLVGGGAFVPDGSGLLTASYPTNSSLTSWTARSKDHLCYAPHQLICYAIGMKLKGIPRDTLMKYMKLITNQSAEDSVYTSTSANLPGNYVLIGGGASVPKYAGQLLCKSYPSNDKKTWNAAARAHGYFYKTQATAYAIGIDTNILGFGTLNVNTYLAGSHFVNTGWDEVSGNPHSDYAMTCMGGECTWGSGGGRMFFEMRPNADNHVLRGIVGSKDHQFVDGGNTYLYICEIKNGTSPLIKGGIMFLDNGGTNAITEYGPNHQGWSSLFLGGYYDPQGQGYWDVASVEGFNPRVANLDRNWVVTNDTGWIRNYINQAKENHAEWIFLDDAITRWLVGQPQITKERMDFVCGLAHSLGMEVATCEDYTTAFGYMKDHWEYYSNVDIIMPYGYSRSTSELENYFNWIVSQTPKKKVVPFLGYHVHHYDQYGIVWDSQTGYRGGGNGFIEMALKYAYNSMIYYYYEPSLNPDSAQYWDDGWVQPGGQKQHLDSLTNYLRVQNYLIRK